MMISLDAFRASSIEAMSFGTIIGGSPKKATTKFFATTPRRRRALNQCSMMRLVAGLKRRCCLRLAFAISISVPRTFMTVFCQISPFSAKALYQESMFASSTTTRWVLLFSQDTISQFAAEESQFATSKEFKAGVSRCFWMCKLAEYTTIVSLAGASGR